GMATELRGSEGAERDDLLVRRARLLDGVGDEAQADALAAEGIRHAGVVDDDLVRADAGEGHLRFGAIRAAHDVATLAAAKVFPFDFRQGVAHDSTPSTGSTGA